MLTARKFLILALVLFAPVTIATMAQKPVPSSSYGEKAAESRKKATIKDPIKNPAIVVPKLKIVTTLAVIKALVKAIGGDFVEVNSLSTALQDPHFINPRPTLKLLVSEAQLFMQIGRSLELWAPQVIASSGNEKLTGDNIVVVSENIPALEVPKTVSRTLGDIHPEGNPHVWLSPLGGLKMAEKIKAVLVAKDPIHKESYEKNFAAFKRKLAEALFGKENVPSQDVVDFLFREYQRGRLKNYLEKQKPKKELGGLLKLAESIDFPFITYHSVWSYLAAELQLKVFAHIEEKAGVPPSPKYQEQLIAKARAAQVKHVVAASYYVGNRKLIDFIAEQIGGKTIFVDVDCRENEDFIAMLDRIISTLAQSKALPPPKVLKP